MLAHSLLRLKHWQAFVLLFILPLLLQQGVPRLLYAADITLGAIATLLLQGVPAIVFTAWLWLLGVCLYRKLPQQIKISRIFVHLCALYFLLYTLLFIYTIGLIKESVLSGNFPYGMLLLLAPMHLLATFCYLYLVYFVARSLVSVEQQRVVSTGEFAGTTFLFLFLPVGIWWLQPRLQALSDKLPVGIKTAS
ncbi:hypothetical protein ACXYMU_17065 [Pontibacter sp. CAU 1760]